MNEDYKRLSGEIGLVQSCCPFYGSARIVEQVDSGVDPFSIKACKDAPFIVQYSCDTLGAHAIPCQTREEAEKVIDDLNERAKQGWAYTWKQITK